MSAKFAHLHVHTHYSLLESVVKVPELVTTAKAFNLPALGVADLGNMHGAVEFYFAAREAGVKPIIGAEIFYVKGSRLDKSRPVKKVQSALSLDDPNRLFHLVLLCQNEEGYQNLCELVTRTWTEGFHNKPRADLELIEKHSKGLIALTAGLKGEVAFHAATGRPDFAEQSALNLQKIFKENLYLEVQESGIPEQTTANRFITEIGEKAGIPLVATSEVFYMRPDQAVAQEVLMSIGSGRNLDENRGNRLVPDEFYFKSPEIIEKEFAWNEEAVRNTLLVADKCNFEFNLKDEKGKMIFHLPDFKSKLSVEDELRERSRTGLEERFKETGFEELTKAPDWKEKKKGYYARLETELEMIIKTGFSGYFLVVSDFIGFAKSKEIPVGPGRGSGAGSIVAYALKITDIDPIPFNLLFERFINPERVSLPDFDVDFCQDRRQEVINYVVEKYGKENVSQIATFGKLLAKGVIRDVSRVLGFSFSEIDPVAKLIPDELGINLETAFQKEPRLQEEADKNPRLAKVFEIARVLEGNNRHASVHAAGVVITNRPLTQYCPLFTGKEQELVIQYDKDYAEKIGLVKFDFLGLKTLTVLANAVKFIRETKDPEFKINTIPMNDPNVFKLISRGDTDGIFQLESSGMKDLCKRVQPSNLEDITAINALFRPGPLNSGMVDDYINRKHGRTEVVYELPQLKDILEETYGVIVYQEQVMRVARVLAGYSLGQADILRRAMGKKKPKEMAEQREIFVAGAKNNKIPENTANHIFDLLAKFAEYGFNKSHSAAYGVLSYQTAYLKTYYPAQFMAALLATEIHDTEGLAQYIGDAKSHGIAILPPDVNHSKLTFSVVELDAGKMGIRFGLEAIKGVGGVAVEVLLTEREKNGPFKSFLDFCTRVSLRKVNKKVLECLISTGAFDSIAEENRATLFESVENVIAHAAKAQEQAEMGQVSFFDQYKSDSFKLESNSDHLFKQVPEWADAKKLQQEKNLVGFYVSGHPMEKWWPVAKTFVLGDLSSLKEMFPFKKQESQRAPRPVQQPGSWKRPEGPKWEITTAALVSTMREIVTKKGTRMAFFEIEDMRTKIECIAFPDSFETFGPMLKKSMEESLPFIISGHMALDEEAPKIFLKGLHSIEDMQSRKITQVVFQLNPKEVNAEKLALLRAAIVKHRGQVATYLEYSGIEFASRHVLPKELCVNPTAEMAREVNLIFGGDVVRFS